MTRQEIILQAVETGRVKDGLVLCENCDNPASRIYSEVLNWTACGACATGEASEVDPGDFIAAEIASGGAGR